MTLLYIFISDNQYSVIFFRDKKINYKIYENILLSLN